MREERLGTTRSAPAARSARRRITYSFRSKASWSAASSADAPTITWRMHGTSAAAVVPAKRRSMGTSRQPSSSCPSEAIAFLDELLDARPLLRVVRQEARADRIGARRRQPLAQLAAEERVRDLDEDPGAVAGVGVGALGAAVLEVRHRA